MQHLQEEPRPQLSQAHYKEWNSRNYRTHAFALKCFPVTLKEIMWLSNGKSATMPTEIYLQLLYLTKLTETFHMLALHSFLFATESHEGSGCFYGGGISGPRSLLTQLGMTQRPTSQETHCAKKKTNKKKRPGAQWSRAQIKHRR